MKTGPILSKLAKSFEDYLLTQHSSFNKSITNNMMDILMSY